VKTCIKLKKRVSEFIKSSFSIGNKYIKCPLDTVADKLKAIENKYDELNIDHLGAAFLKHVDIQSNTVFTAQNPKAFLGFLVLQRQINNFENKNYDLEQILTQNV